MLCYFLHFCLSSCGHSVDEGKPRCEQGESHMQKLRFYSSVSQQRQHIAPGCSWGCQNHASLQMIASFFPKGREANSYVNKCHKNKTQDVFLFSPVIVVIAYNLENQDTPLTSWEKFCDFCLSVGDSKCLPGILARQTKPDLFLSPSSSCTVFIPLYIDQMLWLNASLPLS